MALIYPLCARRHEASEVILLNPGPVKLSAAVRAALTGPDLCHREPEFAELQASIRRRLLAVYGLLPAAWAPVLLAGSGTAAVEAMVSSLTPAKAKLLVIENGVYGERLSRIAKAYNIAHEALSYVWGTPFSINDVEGALEQDSRISGIAVVHHETTTGRLNDLAALDELCRSRGVDLLVDAVSSFGAERLNFERSAIVGCAATANKCLHGAPGVSLVIARRDRLAAGAARTLYLDLANYCREQDARATPFTQPVHLFYALDRALEELSEQGGWQLRRQRYRELALKVRAGLASLGVRPLLPEQDSSAVLAAYHLPEGMSYAALHDALKACGFVIYAGQGELARRIFRVAVMGAITDADIERFIDAIRTVMQSRA